MIEELFRVSWLDSCDMPSRIHLTRDGIDTLCGGRSEYLKNRTLVQVPRKILGRSRYCRTCFKRGGKSAPWYKRCANEKGQA